MSVKQPDRHLSVNLLVRRALGDCCVWHGNNRSYYDRAKRSKLRGIKKTSSRESVCSVTYSFLSRDASAHNFDTYSAYGVAYLHIHLHLPACKSVVSSSCLVVLGALIPRAGSSWEIDTCAKKRQRRGQREHSKHPHAVALASLWYKNLTKKLYLATTK